MTKRSYSFSIILVLFIFSATQSGIAQNGLIIDQVEKSYPTDAFNDLYPDNEIWDNLDLRIKTFLGTNLAKLEKAGNELGQPTEIEKMKLYIKDQMFRMDSETEDGKMTGILRTDLGIMYQINWDENIVIKISDKELEKMRSGAMDVAKQMQQNMPANMEQMLENLPKEQREKALEALKATGHNFPGMTEKKSKPILTDMHRTKDFTNFPNCNEYRIVDGDKYMAVWAYNGKPGIAKMFHEFSEKFKNSMGMEDEDSDALAGLPKEIFPIFTITYEENMMSGLMLFKTSYIEQLQETDIPLSIFEAYKDPRLKEGSMMDMMNLKRRKR